MKGPTVDLDGGLVSRSGSSVSTSLLVRLKEREPGAWSVFWSLYGGEVGRWCRIAGVPAQDAEDVSQEVFRSVSSSLTDFRRERPGDSFRGWLWTITQNKIRDHWRRRDARPDAAGGSDAQVRIGQLPSAPDDPSGSEVVGTTSGLARRALEFIRSSFEERTWKAFWGVVVDERPADEVARELGTTPNAVYVARSRVLSRLRAEFGELLE